MENLLTLFFEDICNAIRAIDETTEPIKIIDIPSRIKIPNKYKDTSDATALPEDIVANKVAYIQTGRIIGTASNIAHSISVVGTGIISPQHGVSGDTIVFTVPLSSRLLSIKRVSGENIPYAQRGTTNTATVFSFIMPPSQVIIYC